MNKSLWCVVLGHAASGGGTRHGPIEQVLGERNESSHRSEKSHRQKDWSERGDKRKKWGHYVQTRMYSIWDPVRCQTGRRMKERSGDLLLRAHRNTIMSSNRPQTNHTPTRCHLNWVLNFTQNSRCFNAVKKEPERNKQIWDSKGLPSVDRTHRFIDFRGQTGVRLDSQQFQYLTPAHIYSVDRTHVIGPSSFTESHFKTGQVLIVIWFVPLC